MRNLARDVAYGTNVKGLSSVAAADTNFTVTFTSTTTATQTVQPYTNISQVTADNRTTHGWAMNQNLVSNDAMASTATAERIIPAGTWNFSFGWTSNDAPLFYSYTVVVSYHVYRVAANGGTRSLLFSASAAAVTVNTAGGNDTAAAASTQPEYTIQPNETIHVAVQIQSAAAPTLLGGPTPSVITCRGATAGAFSVSFPTPGIRTLYYDTSSAVGAGQGSKALLIAKDNITAAGVGRGLISKMAMYHRSLQAVASGTGSLEKAAIFARNLNAIGSSRNSLNRAEIFVRSFAAVGKATIRPRIGLDWNRLLDAGGGYRPLFLFDD